MIEATTQNCPHCHGTGLIRSEENLALSIIRQIEDEGVRGRSKEVVVNCPVSVANFIVNQKRDHITNIEARFSLFVRINADTTLVSPEYSIEKLKTSSKPLSDKSSVSVSSAAIGASDVEMLDDKEDDGSSSSSENGYTDDDNKPKKRRRRRRRKPRQGEVPELAENEPEMADSVNEIASEGLENSLEKEGSVLNQSDAADNLLLKEKKQKAASTKGKREPRKNKKDERLKDSAKDTKTVDGMDSSAAIELTENANDPKTQTAKTKSRVRKKVIKDDSNLKDQADVAESTLVSESGVSTAKSEKKSTKLTKAKAVKSAKAKLGSETSKTLGKQEKISEMDDKSTIPEKDEKKKTRRRGWWSKDG